MLFHEREIAAIEALLFVAKEPLSVKKIAEILELSPNKVLDLIDDLKEKYKSLSSGITIIEIEDAFRLGTKPEMAKFVEILYKQPTQTLSNAALEVLSIIAYRQPVTRGEIDFIRGVQSDKVLATLADKGLIKELGRKEGPGRPILYGTTDNFLLHFGLNSIDELPKFEDFGNVTEESEEE
ncbi:MAG: SMC-Scp complex subunit ScpB [Peptococcaceae bacterium]|jgi:segregation and condensation protein B|nr:SMC-Scp complex subunit ScpB [Peptococcaceae bacterium]